MPSRLLTIDELTRPDHTYLAADDECHYLGEYTARAGFSFSATNDLIQNLKKPMDRRGRPEWRYKEQAIRAFGQQLGEAMNADFLSKATLVPVPPSHRPDDPAYDDRMLQILRAMAGSKEFDIRELVTMRVSIEPAHLKESSRSVEALVEAFAIDTRLLSPSPTAIAIFDDVLTTGAHFAAMKRLLRRRFPETPLCGIFLARRDPKAAEV